VPFQPRKHPRRGAPRSIPPCGRAPTSPAAQA
jgi:hypothetical protein